MYANRITLTVNEKEAFLKFDCMGPKYDEENKVVDIVSKDCQEIIIDTDGLIRLKDMIEEFINNTKGNEQQ